MTDLQRTSGTRLAIGARPLIVAAVHSLETLQLAARLAQAPATVAPDLLELRVDHFAADPGLLDALAAAPPRPLVLTVRRPDEGGGAPDLDDQTRKQLYARFLPRAAAVDLEVRSLAALAEIVGVAADSQVPVIGSFHNFQGTPTLAKLREIAELAQHAGADILKVAAFTRSPGDLATLLQFLAEEKRLPLALMGMGPLGKASRLVLAAAGSVLNYGYLGAGAQVPGQWPADLLRARLEELC